MAALEHEPSQIQLSRVKLVSVHIPFHEIHASVEDVNACQWKLSILPNLGVPLCAGQIIERQ